MKMRKNIIISILLFVLLFIVIQQSTGLREYIIQSNSVFINNTKGFINVSPHTINKSSWVYSQLMSNSFSGNIDVCFGVNSSYIKFSSLEKLDDDGNWSRMSIDNIINYNYDGFNKWYCKRNISIVAGKLYQIRFLALLKYVWRGHVEGKYSVAMKLSSDSIHEAISSGRFIYLDPWYNTSYWDYQETADTFTFTGDWEYYPTNADDGNWNSFTRDDNDVDGWNCVYAYFNVLSRFTNQSKVKYRIGVLGIKEYNISDTPGCFNYSGQIQLELCSKYEASNQRHSRIACNNGTWQIFDSDMHYGTTASHTYIYEVAVNWSVTNFAPIINYNVTVPSLPGYDDFFIQVNVSEPDGDNISWCNFTAIAPNGSIVLNNIMGTRYNNTWWNSSVITVVNHTGHTGTWNISVTCADNAPTKAYGGKNWSFTIVDNVSPVVLSNVSIQPSIAYSNDTLNCSIRGSDNLEVLKANMTWYVNNKSVLNDTNNYLINNVTYTFDVLNSSYFNKSDIVSCNVTLYDDSGNTVMDQSSITISNSVPIVENVTISPSPASSSDDLNCTYNYYDLDGDSMVNAYFNWTINNVLSSVHTQILGSGNISANDVVYCSVKVSDGDDNSTWVNSPSINLSDSVPPIMSDYKLDVKSGYTDEIHHIFVNCTDVESGLANNYPKVSYVDPNGITQGNFTMTLVTGDQYRYSTTFSIVGMYTDFKFYCMDAQSNLASNTSTGLTFTSSTRPTPTQTGGGGAVSVSKKDCNITIVPDRIMIYENTNIEKFDIISNEEETIVITFVLGELEKYIKLSFVDETLASYSLIEVSVLPADDLQRNITFNGTLILASDKCYDISVPIIINTQEKAKTKLQTNILTEKLFGVSIGGTSIPINLLSLIIIMSIVIVVVLFKSRKIRDLIRAGAVGLIVFSILLAVVMFISIMFSIE